MGNSKTFSIGNVRVTIEDVTPVSTHRSVVNRHQVGCTCPQCAPNREPDGIDAHIDRPLRENYGGWAPAAEAAFRADLAKYRNAESAIKACTWPAREPMGNTPSWPVPQQHTTTTVVRTAVRQQPRDEWGRFVPTCGVSSRSEKRVAERAGMPPIGATVRGYTWDGQVIFDR